MKHIIIGGFEEEEIEFTKNALEVLSEKIGTKIHIIVANKDWTVKDYDKTIKNINDEYHIVFIRGSKGKNTKEYEKKWNINKEVMYKYNMDYVQINYDYCFIDTVHELDRMLWKIVLTEPYPLLPQNEMLEVVKQIIKKHE